MEGPLFTPEARRRRRRKVLIAFAIGLPVAMVLCFFKWRADDLHAWPALQPGALPERTEAASPLTAEEMFAFLEAMPPATNAPMRAYALFQSHGAAALDTNTLATLRGRLGADAANAVAYHALLAAHDGFTTNHTGANLNVRFAANCREWAIWLMAAMQLREGGFSPADRGRSAALHARLLTKGAGLAGHAVALEILMLHSRETVMESIEAPEYPEALARALIAGFREAEAPENLRSIVDALTDDHAALLANAQDQIYPQLFSREAKPVNRVGEGTTPIYSNFRVGGTTAWLMRRLGADMEDTRAHLDALFSVLAANAEQPYSPTGLLTGLPPWCSGGKRPPWTRDPVGAILGEGYLRHARYGAALEPNIRLELRAARIAAALRVWRDRHQGVWPAALSDLLKASEGEEPLLTAADIADPFAPDGAALRYALDGEKDWRLWSVGLDQKDDGGLQDAMTAEDRKAREQADFIFTSHERLYRKAHTPL